MRVWKLGAAIQSSQMSAFGESLEAHEWRRWVESGLSLKAERTAAFRPRTLQTCHSASGQELPFTSLT